ncbi:MAG: AAA family ATPase, partial [Desulfovibrionaceae bacterium]|nr:AAA family ATPase [Desulfovibrionaceae bacterium]
MTERRSIDRGAFSFSELIEYGRYYVDKTSYLKELFMGVGSAKAPLFTRPRRFGKTLNMSMIQDFCELNYQNPGDTSY